MKRHRPKTFTPQYFSAHETKRLRSLDGIRLASFRARGLAIFFDVFVILILFSTGFWIVDGGKEFKSHFNVTFDSTKESGVTATVGGS